MELTRVSRQRAEQPKSVAPTGGDVDPLALLLGGDQASAFPATLEAAIAGGEVGEEPIALDGESTGDDTGADDGSGQTIDLAIAAALALGNALATPADAETTAADAVDGTTLVDSGAGTVPNVTDGTLNSAAAAGATGPGTEVPASTTAIPTTPATATTSTAATAEAGAADAAAKAAAAAADAAHDAANDAADATAEAKLADAATSATEPDAATARAASGGSTEPSTAGRRGETAPAPGEEAAARHGASAGIEPDRASFASTGGEQQHGLDLASSERDHTAAPFTAEKPAQVHASAPATELARPEAPPLVQTASVDAPSTSTVTTTTATNAPAATHGTAAPRTDRLEHPPGVIEPRWGERVADAVRLSSVRGGSEIRLRLEPEGLGHIDVRLHLQGDGVRAVIVAEHESTRALLTSQQHVLHEALERSDIRLSGFTVDVGAGGNGAASFTQPDGQGSGADTTAGPAWGRQNARSDEAADETTTTTLGNGRVSVRV